uniref:Nuclear protein MDM1 n=1 Tax=Aotus nancymaae TaxID=37293 RepID=A0A2K5CKC7_AOTNA
MPVRFKGLSEYQRNFLWKKSYLSESCNSSVGRKYPWAGLRSDQLGIVKEPSFISKRRVPYHDPQISKSLEWNGANSESIVVVSPEPEAPETPKSQEAEQKDVTQDRVHPLEASRVPKRTRSHSADSRAEGASDVVENNEGVANHKPVNENVELEQSVKVLSENVDNRVGIFTAFLLKSIEFFVGVILISVILRFVFQNFPLFSCLMRIVDKRLLTLVTVN